MMVCSIPLARLVGGDSIVANELTEHYLRAGHQVTLVSIHPNAIPGPSKSLLGIDVLGYRPEYGRRTRIAIGELLDLYDPKACSFLKRVLQDKQPDCVHFQGLHNGVSSYGPQVARRLGTPSIVSVHGVPPICALYRLDRLPDHQLCSGPSPVKCLVCKRPSRYRIPVPFRNYFFRQFALAASDIIAPSSSTRDWLISDGYPADQVKALHHGVDTGHFCPQSEPVVRREDNSFHVLYVGRVRAKKGIQYLLAACSDLAERGHPIKLRIVGDYQPNAIDDPSVHFEGPIERERLPRYYQEADVLVQPSITYESFGLTLLEGMASGIPVIATDMGAMPEVVGDCGIIVPPKDSRALAQAIESLILDPDLRRRLAQRGRERAERQFTWESKAAEYLEHLTDLVNGNRAVTR